MPPPALSSLLVDHPALADAVRWYLEIVAKHGAESPIAKERAASLDKLAGALGVRVTDKGK